MSDSRSDSTDAAAEGVVVEEDSSRRKSQRPITLYDVVAGKIGMNGFMTREQMQSSHKMPAGPEEVLIRRSAVLEKLVRSSYETTRGPSAALPESDMLKAIHTYAADFYNATAKERGKFDFRSLDETALIAVGVLLEEAVRETLGESGDMVFVEPSGLENGLDESKMTEYQVRGRVKPLQRGPAAADEDDGDEDASPAKKQRR